MKKLVRDAIGNLEWTSFPEMKQALRPVYGNAEHTQLLNKKLLEEVGELLCCTDQDELLGEIADVYEVLYAIAERSGLYWGDVMARVVEKRDERGSFVEGVVFEF